MKAIITNNGLIKDFLSSLEIEFPMWRLGGKEKLLNVSFTDEGLVFLRTANKFFKNHAWRKEFLDYIRSEFTDDHGYSMMTVDKARSLTQCYETSNNNVINDYLPEASELFYVDYTKYEKYIDNDEVFLDSFKLKFLKLMEAFKNSKKPLDKNYVNNIEEINASLRKLLTKCTCDSLVEEYVRFWERLYIDN